MHNQMMIGSLVNIILTKHPEDRDINLRNGLQKFGFFGTKKSCRRMVGNDIVQVITIYHWPKSSPNKGKISINYGIFIESVNKALKIDYKIENLNVTNFTLHGNIREKHQDICVDFNELFSRNLLDEELDRIVFPYFERFLTIESIVDEWQKQGDAIGLPKNGKLSIAILLWHLGRTEEAAKMLSEVFSEDDPPRWITLQKIVKQLEASAHPRNLDKLNKPYLTNEGNTMTFYNKTGTPVCYSDDDLNIYSFAGDLLGTISNTQVINSHGTPVGWKINGWLIDQDSRYAFFSKSSVGGPVKPTPLPDPYKATHPKPRLPVLRPIVNCPRVLPLAWSKYHDLDYFKEASLKK